MENNILDKKTVTGVDKPFPIAVKYGLMGAALLAFIMLTKLLTGGFNPDSLIAQAESGGGGFTIFDWLMVIVAMGGYTYIYLMAIKEYRKQLGGFISFGQGFKVAFLSILVKAAALLIFTWLFYNFFIDSEGFFDAFRLIFEETMAEASNGDENTEEAMMSMMDSLLSPTSFALLRFLKTIFGGIILSLIAAAIGQKQEEF